MTRREEMERDLLDLFECEPRANADTHSRNIAAFLDKWAVPEDVPEAAFRDEVIACCAAKLAKTAADAIDMDRYRREILRRAKEVPSE